MVVVEPYPIYGCGWPSTTVCQTTVYGSCTGVRLSPTIYEINILLASRRFGIGIFGATVTKNGTLNAQSHCLLMLPYRLHTSYSPRHVCYDVEPSRRVSFAVQFDTSTSLIQVQVSQSTAIMPLITTLQSTAENLGAWSAAEGFEFDAQESHLRCRPHTVHLAVLCVSQLTNIGETTDFSLLYSRLRASQCNRMR